MPDVKPLLSDRYYNILKKSATLVLPAVGALYFALAQIWSFPKAEEVVGSIAAVNTFLGVVLGLATKSYNNSDAKYLGSVDTSIDPETGQPKYAFTLDGVKLETLDTTKVAALKDISFKVTNTSS